MLSQGATGCGWWCDGRECQGKSKDRMADRSLRAKWVMLEVMHYTPTFSGIFLSEAPPRLEWIQFQNHLSLPQFTAIHSPANQSISSSTQWCCHSSSGHNQPLFIPQAQLLSYDGCKFIEYLIANFQVNRRVSKIWMIRRRNYSHIYIRDVAQLMKTAINVLSFAWPPIGGISQTNNKPIIDIN